MYISGIVYHKDTKEMRIVSALELKNIIMTEMHKRPTDFNNLYIRTVEVLFLKTLPPPTPPPPHKKWKKETAKRKAEQN